MSASLHQGQKRDCSGPTSVLAPSDTGTFGGDVFTSTSLDVATNSPSTLRDMAVTRGSAKRSSCCPSSATTVSGDPSTASESNAPSHATGATAPDDGANSVHHRGGGQRLSKRPALVDRTNNRSSSSVSAQANPGHPGLCPDSQASAPANEPVVTANAALTNAVPSLQGDAEESQRVPSSTIDGPVPQSVMANPGIGGPLSGFNGTTSGLGHHGSGANQSRGSSRRSVGSQRGRSRGRGMSSTGSGSSGARRRRSDGGHVLSGAKPMSGLSSRLGAMLDGYNDIGTSSETSMDCDRHTKESDFTSEDAQRLLLSDETLNSLGDGIGLEGYGLPGSGSEGQFTLKSGKQQTSNFLVTGLRDEVESEDGSRDDKLNSRLLAPSSAGAAPLSCCRSFNGSESNTGGNGIQLLAVHEDLGSLVHSAPAVASGNGALSGRPALNTSHPIPCEPSLSLGQPWFAANSKIPSAEDLSSSVRAEKQESQLIGLHGASTLITATTDNGPLSAQGPSSAQDKIPGSAVQAAESAMASLQRHAERSLQISSIRQNRTSASSAEDWSAQSGEQIGYSQPLRGTEGLLGPPAEVPATSLPQVPPRPFFSVGEGVQALQHEQQQRLGQHLGPNLAGVHLSLQCHPPSGFGHTQQHLSQDCQPEPQLAQHFQPYTLQQQQQQQQQHHEQQLQHHLQLQQQQQLVPHQQQATAMPVEFLQQSAHSHQGQSLPCPGPLPPVCQPVAASHQGAAAGSAQPSARVVPSELRSHTGAGDGAVVPKGFAPGQGCFTQFMDIDGNHSDPQLCASYAADIFHHLRSSEMRRRPVQGYMETVQTDINEQMRGILIDWLVEVAEEYKLVADTLYLTCSFIDRFLSTKTVTRGRLQLLGVSCMLIASKYEEIYAPQVDEFCYITDNTYRREEVIEMERAVLQELHFELSYPTIKSFLRRFVRAAQADLPRPSIELELLGNYFAELTLVDYNSLKFLPSVIAASAVFLAKRTLWPDTQPWTSTLRHYSNFAPSQLEECTRSLHDLHCNKKGCTLPAIREKYRQAKFQHVASTPPCPELPASVFEDGLS